MSFKLRHSVPQVWVLLSIVTLSASKTSIQVEEQFWLAEPSHPLVIPDLNSLDFSADLSTVKELSWFSGRMSFLTAEQKQNIRCLYKIGRKIAHSEAHIHFLSKCLEFHLIPKSFRIKNTIPGNKQINQGRIDQISMEAIDDERANQINKLEFENIEFENQKKGLEGVFSKDAASEEIKRVEKHIERVKKLKSESHEKKIANYNNIENAHNDDTEMEHPDDLYMGLERIFQENGNPKRRRRFKRKYLQPQMKKIRKRKSKPIPAENNIPEGWNGAVKNISGVPISKVEESLFKKGKKFCPVEKDPPILRMQKELNNFYRNLRLEWHFFGQEDGRSDLEKRFYPKSNWKPPKACVDIENYISRIQEKFDRWKPSKKVSDNLSKEERKFLKSVKENDDIIYMWEDKGPSFVKLNREQYLRAGNVELENDKFYQEMIEYSPEEIKRKNDFLVDEMLQKNEIPLKVAEFLKGGQCEIAKFYHLLKTHKIPATIDDPSDWLTENGFPIRGIVSGIKTPTERLSGFVDYFLQPGMQSLKTFLKDGKHTLKVIEEINDQIKSGEISLEGVALVSLDVEAMYNNMT